MEGILIPFIDSPVHTEQHLVLLCGGGLFCVLGFFLVCVVCFFFVVVLIFVCLFFVIFVFKDAPKWKVSSNYLYLKDLH